MMHPNLPMREMLSVLKDLAMTHPAHAGSALAVLMVVIGIAVFASIGLRTRARQD